MLALRLIFGLWLLPNRLVRRTYTFRLDVRANNDLIRDGLGGESVEPTGNWRDGRDAALPRIIALVIVNGITVSVQPHKHANWVKCPAGWASES